MVSSSKSKQYQFSLLQLHRSVRALIQNLIQNIDLCLHSDKSKIIYTYKTITSNLSKAHKTRDSLSSCCLQVVQVYLQPCQRNSLMKCAPQPKIAKNTKPPILGVQGHSWSSLKSSSPVLVLISRMTASICNCFHAKAVK